MDPMKIELPQGITREEFLRIFEVFDYRHKRKKEKARLRRQWKKEGKTPPRPEPHTYIYPNTYTHSLLAQISRGPTRLEDIQEDNGRHFLRLLKWSLIYLDTIHPGFVHLNCPIGEEALNLLEQGITATIYKEA